MPRRASCGKQVLGRHQRAGSASDQPVSGAEDYPASVYSFHTSDQVGQMLLHAGFDVDEAPIAIGEVLLVTAGRRASM